MFDKFKKNKDIDLDPNVAEDILGQVFIHAGKPSNTVPLEALTSYSSYRRERYTTQRGIIIAMLLLFVVIPIFFIRPKFGVKEVFVSGDNYDSQFEITVDTPLPLSSITASIDGINLPIYELDDHKFYCHPSKNGDMIITVTLFNKQFAVKKITVANVDSVTPKCLSAEYDAEHLFLLVSDDDSGINYEGIEGTFSDGTVVKPISYDPATGQVIFDYPVSDMNLFIPDNAGNILQLAITMKDS